MNVIVLGLSLPAALLSFLMFVNTANRLCAEQAGKTSLFYSERARLHLIPSARARRPQLW